MPYFDAQKSTSNHQLTLIEGPMRFHAVVANLEPPTVEISLVLSASSWDWHSFESWPLAPCFFRTLNCERMRLPLSEAFGAIAFRSLKLGVGFTVVISFTATCSRAPRERNQKQKVWNYWILPLLNLEDTSWVSGCRQEYLQALCTRASTFNSLDYFENSTKRQDSSKHVCL